MVILGFEIPIQFVAAGFIIWITIGFLCANLALKKGYEYWWGFVTGFLLGIIGLIYYAGMPMNNAKNKGNEH